MSSLSFSFIFLVLCSAEEFERVLKDLPLQLGEDEDRKEASPERLSRAIRLLSRLDSAQLRRTWLQFKGSRRQERQTNPDPSVKSSSSRFVETQLDFCRVSNKMKKGVVKLRPIFKGTYLSTASRDRVVTAFRPPLSSWISLWKGSFKVDEPSGPWSLLVWPYVQRAFLSFSDSLYVYK